MKIKYHSLNPNLPRLTSIKYRYSSLKEKKTGSNTQSPLLINYKLKTFYPVHALKDWKSVVVVSQSHHSLSGLYSSEGLATVLLTGVGLQLHKYLVRR